MSAEQFADPRESARVAYHRARDCGDLKRRDWQVLNALHAIIGPYPSAWVTVDEVRAISGVRDPVGVRRSFRRLIERRIMWRVVDGDGGHATTGLGDPPKLAVPGSVVLMWLRDDVPPPGKVLEVLEVEHRYPWWKSPKYEVWHLYEVLIPIGRS